MYTSSAAARGRDDGGADALEESLRVCRVEEIERGVKSCLDGQDYDDGGREPAAEPGL